MPGKQDHEDKAAGFEYRLEGDWSESGRALAASAVLAHDEADPLVVADPAEAFNRRQRQFLSQCADTALADQHLVVLGPVTATKWADVAVGDHKVSVERWTVGTLDFLELSVRVKKKDGDTANALRRRALKQQTSLAAEAFVRGLTKDASPITRLSEYWSSL